jgi:hypothetical protein
MRTHQWKSLLQEWLIIRETLSGRKYPLACASCEGAEAVSQLCVGYGRTLYDETMVTDPLYASSEVFNMTTASVNRFYYLLTV